MQDHADEREREHRDRDRRPQPERADPDREIQEAAAGAGGEPPAPRQAVVALGVIEPSERVHRSALLPWAVARRPRRVAAALTARSVAGWARRARARWSRPTPGALRGCSARRGLAGGWAWPASAPVPAAGADRRSDAEAAAAGLVRTAPRRGPRSACAVRAGAERRRSQRRSPRCRRPGMRAAPCSASWLCRRGPSAPRPRRRASARSASPRREPRAPAPARAAGAGRAEHAAAPDAGERCSAACASRAPAVRRSRPAPRPPHRRLRDPPGEAAKRLRAANAAGSGAACACRAVARAAEARASRRAGRAAGRSLRARRAGTATGSRGPAIASSTPPSSVPTSLLPAISGPAVPASLISSAPTANTAAHATGSTSSIPTALPTRG